MSLYFVQTKRVGLRRFKPDDLPDFAALNADPVVMEYFPNTLSREDCQAYMDRINAKIDKEGYGFWAAEELPSNRLMGFVGITSLAYQTDFTPAVEIGWRLARPFWGRGLATEAARGCLKFAFGPAALSEIVSFTSIHNQRSARVMERLGMRRAGEFDHPGIKAGHDLQRHVLYRITASEFENAERLRQSIDR